MRNLIWEFAVPEGVKVINEEVTGGAIQCANYVKRVIASGVFVDEGKTSVVVHPIHQLIRVTAQGE